MYQTAVIYNETKETKQCFLLYVNREIQFSGKVLSTDEFFTKLLWFLMIYIHHYWGTSTADYPYLDNLLLGTYISLRN